MNNLQSTNQGQVEQVPFGAVQHNLSNIMPSASEVGNLWSSYQVESMSACFLKTYSKYITEDEKLVSQFAQ